MAEPTLFDEASLALIASGGAGKDGKVYSVKPVPVYGPELVTNGDFATDSDWSVYGSNIAISGGKANFTNAVTNTEFLQQAITAPTGVQYRIQFEVSNLAAGDSIKVRFPFQDTTINSNGLHTLYGDGATADFLRITPNSSTGTFSIDNVSVKKVLSGDGDFTFSRGSNLAATRVGPTGLIEKGRENLLLQSNQFDTTWGMSGAGAVTLTPGQSGYDGSSDAWLLEKTAASFAQINQSVSYNGVHTLSVYAKEGTSGTMSMRFFSAVDGYAYFDLSAGTIIANSTAIINSSIEAVGNGWYRCSATINASSNNIVFIYPEAPYSGATAGNIYIQDAQLEIGLAATDYIESGATTGKAGLLENEPRFDYSGGATCPSLLLEPSRTQLVTQSEYFGDSYYLKSNITFEGFYASPSGLNDSYKILETATNTEHRINSGYIGGINSGDFVTYSVFAKYSGRQWLLLLNSFGSLQLRAYFDIENGNIGTLDSGVTADIKDYGNGWYRCSMTAQANAAGGRLRMHLVNVDGGFAYLGDITKGVYIYGTQAEVGSYPTSYIPNHSGGSVTRGGEGRVNRLSSPITFGAGEDFTLYFEGEFNTINNFPMVMGGRTTSTAYWWIQNETTGKLSSDSGTEMATYTGGNITINTRHKLLVKRESNVITFYQNGAALTTTQRSGVADAWSFQSLGYGFNDSGSYAFSGKVYQALVFPTALSDADCISLTTL